MNCHLSLVCFGLFACTSTQGALPRSTMPSLESDLMLALQGDDELVRCEAIRVLGMVGEERHIALIEPFADAEIPELRRAARATLRRLMAAQDSPALDRELEVRLASWLGDGNRFCQQDALTMYIGLGDTADLASVEGMLGSNDFVNRVKAAWVLAHQGKTLHPRDRSMVLTEAAGTPYEGMATRLFEQVSAEDRALVEPYLVSQRPEVRYAASEALRRLEEGQDGGPATDSLRRRAQYSSENGYAAARLLRRSWHEEPLADVVAHLAAVRLVLFGEIHDDDGPLRDAQRQLLRAMVKVAPGHVVLGYEPSVQTPQQSVLDEAARLGVPAVSMEPSWQELVAELRYADCDVECAQVIAACFAKDPDCHLLVLRGESHTLPDGFLARRLPVPAKFVLTLQPPQLRVIGDRALTGRAFRLGDDGDAFYWGTEEPEAWAPTLAKWLQQRRAAAARPSGQ